jgi:hypothetical protein
MVADCTLYEKILWVIRQLHSRSNHFSVWTKCRDRLLRFDDINVNLMFPVQSNLKDGSLVQFSLAKEQDVDPLRALYRVIVEEGNSYPHDQVPDHDEFMDYWFRGKRTIVAYVPDRERAADSRSVLSQAELAGGKQGTWRMPASLSRPNGGIRDWADCWERPCCTVPSNLATGA